MKHQLYILVFALCFAGCKKDTVIPHDISGPKLAFVKAATNGGVIVQSEYTYNEHGNIKTRTSYKDYAAGLMFSKTTFTYESGKLI
ncbi:MAG TPA: hypothetical protein PLR74_04815 [Agriterribacter sp.]|nr:hypothetical protein [Agriterribacter sp.]